MFFTRSFISKQDVNKHIARLRGLHKGQLTLTAIKASIFQALLLVC